MTRCKRHLAILTVPVGASGSVEVTLDRGTVEVTLRVVDAAGAGVVWELGRAGTSPTFHFAAGESYTEERMALTDALTLRIEAASGSVVELIAWEE